MSNELRKYDSEYLSEAQRQRWEQLAKNIPTLPVNDTYYTKTPEDAYKNLRQTMDLCGFRNKEDFAGKRILIIGCGLGLEVRIARDIGIDAVGVDYEEEIVQVGFDLGIVSQSEVSISTASVYLKKQQPENFDAVVGLHQLFSNEGQLYNLRSIYDEAFNALKPGGTFLVWGNISDRIKKRMGGRTEFPWEFSTQLYPDKELIRATKIS